MLPCILKCWWSKCQHQTLYFVSSSSLWTCGKIYGTWVRNFTRSKWTDSTLVIVSSCACRHRHLEVWLRPWSDTAWRTSLARRPRLGVFQARSDSSPYLSDYCVPAADVDNWQHLHSAIRQLLAVPRYRLNTYGRRAFSVAGLTVWNSFPDFIRDPTISADSFRHLLKTYLFTRY